MKISLLSSTILLVCLTNAVAWTDDGCSEPNWSTDGPATRYLLNDAALSDNAVCLDGSPGAYYFQPGTGNGTNKWYIHHQGGGWCEGLDDCLSRSKGALGSSASYPATASLGGGYFSTDPTVSPLMYNWNHVYLRYCDGASFSGSNSTVTVYQGAKLHFRGSHIREAMVKDLLTNHGLGKASDVVISGCSAGGLATFLHTDQWCDTLKQETAGNVKCVGMPDSGLFLDFQDPRAEPFTPPGMLGNTNPGNYHAGLKWVFEFQNTSSGINQDCIQAHQSTEDTWMCQFAQHTAVHTHTPLFPLQSVYDSWQTGHVLFDGSNVASVNILGKNITRQIELMMAANPESGAFLDSCHHHCGAWNSIRIDGDLVGNAFTEWYEGIGTKGAKKLWNQNKVYPCTACCTP